MVKVATVNVSRECSLFTEIKSSLDGLDTKKITGMRKKLMADNKSLSNISVRRKNKQKGFFAVRYNGKSCFDLKLKTEESNSTIYMMLIYALKHAKEVRDRCPIKRCLDKCFLSALKETVPAPTSA